MGRLEESQAKLREVERDREHWRLELQLLQIKLEKNRSESTHQEVKVEVSLNFCLVSREYGPVPVLLLES